MPLSKKGDAKVDKLVGCKNDIMWLDGVKLVGGVVLTKDDALQSISSGIKRETNSTVPPVVQPIPNCPDGRYRDK